MLPLIGMALLTGLSTAYSANAAASSNIRNMNAASKAEGENIARERLNQTIRNSYSTAFAQANLALQKRQLSERKAGIGAAGLAATGDVTAMAAATGSTGASADAAAADIQMKVAAAEDQTVDAYENAMTNYNNELKSMVINTDSSAPQVRAPVYNGPSGGDILGMGLMAGAMAFGSNYAMRSMSLGLGPAASAGNAGQGLMPGSGGLGLQYRW